MDELAETVNTGEAERTVIVFDAADAPSHLAAQETHRGFVVIYARDCESADECMENMLRNEKDSKSLTVVSSDHRVRLAARKRRASVMTSEEYWRRLDELKEKRASKPKEPPPAPNPKTREELAREQGLDESESAFWMREFAEIAHDPEINRSLAKPDPIVSDEEIKRIEREVSREKPPFRRK